MNSGEYTIDTDLDEISKSSRNIRRISSPDNSRRTGKIKQAQVEQQAVDTHTTPQLETWVLRHSLKRVSLFIWWFEDTIIYCYASENVQSMLCLGRCKTKGRDWFIQARLYTPWWL